MVGSSGGSCEVSPLYFFPKKKEKKKKKKEECRLKI
jgi:hypothetical protein